MRTIYRIVFLLLTLIPATSFAVEQDLNMKSITIHDGLAGESVFKIYKSMWNVMWVGTSNGLSSYDGFHVQTFRIAEQRSRNIINDIVQSSDGYIWVATTEGIYKVDGMTSQLSKALPKIKGNTSVIKIIGDRIFCGTDDGLYISSTRRGKNDVEHVWLNKNHIVGNNKVNDMFVEGNALFVLCNYELYRYDVASGKVMDYHLRGQVRLNNALRKIVKSGNRILIGSYNDGLFVYNIKERKLSPYIDVNCRVITCLSLDRGSNILYVGTDGAGLHVIDLKTNRIIETYSTASSSKYRLKDNTVYAYYHDSTGVDFFGYYRQGLHHNYFKKSLFRPYIVDGLFDSRGKNIRSICIDGNVKVLGGRVGLWYVDEGKGVTKFFSPEELGGSIVTNVVKYCGQYYCCTFNGGVMRIDPKTLTTSRFGNSDALRTSSFGCLKVSPENELWMSGNAGVYIYNAMTDKERHYDYRNSALPNAYCNSIIFDKQERCWISTAKGLCLYDPVSRTIQVNDFPEGFFNNRSELAGAIGDGDNLLFWSLDGLFRTNEEMTKYEMLNAKTPAATQYVSQMIYDKRHRNYWVSTETGMFRYDREMNGFQKFAYETGLMTREFNNSAITITDNRTLWTGTMQGLYSCNLDDAEKFIFGNAKIVLDEMMFDGKAAEGETVAMMVRERFLKLSYHWGAQVLSFIPVLMNYCDQSQLCFEYRFDKKGEWKHANGQETINIDGLKLGQTIMEIRLAGTKYITEYYLYTLPSGWFLFEIIGIAVFLVVMTLLYRQRRLAKKQQEEMVRVQRELEEAKRKYSRVNISEGEQQRLLRLLEEYMRSDKPYMNNELKLSDVASHLDVSTAKLSQLFSMHLQKNYYDYINSWRLKEFKELLNDKRYAQYTLIALAEECGFKRSSFFSTFKKVEGVTPTEYVKQKRS